jgi:hypothetical protein
MVRDAPINTPGIAGNTPLEIDTNHHSVYDGQVPPDTGKPLPGSENTNTEPPATRTLRILKSAAVTVTVTYVSGPGAQHLARRQYEAIRKVLTWLHTHPE